MYGIELNNCHFEKIQEAFEYDEEVLLSLGTSSEQAVVFTNQRLILIEPSLGLLWKKSYKLKSFSYDSINIVSSRGAILIIKTLRDQDLMLGNIYQEKVDEAVYEINSIVHKYKSDGSPELAKVIQQTSSADELKKFKELLDMGIITQEEFDAKKKQLLGL